ncbi:uncharacterized protein THITE_2115692 [Thermothielavioides terrestris NRRL 8126]|uniref:DASH complex subunit ASK1 n=1 Tax=Thermothielavioides terrestris (strain ATCC 38088 / NRRL 8126) TaxID=578455 RepID=G2R5D1_THETT|nr:uncharacterized protein THITE_2115692 [Thermothielavioides terrestris NRRL 8126]AEO67011.1 hypothetical protein THITE_2115692 [Thermothielavioides terrestris NRRL 8126]
MSRPGPSAPRNLTLTEELEKLEQSITLTLQEIDHNFSKAHRIVTTSILPLVEQYGEHSRSVWEATKFWKQFFEASANVSLSGYEELAGGEESTAMTTEEESTVHNETTADYTPRPRSAGRHDHDDSTSESTAIYHGPGSGRQEESVLGDNDGDLTGSTPRLPATKTLSSRPQFAGLSSPFEALKREYDNNKSGDSRTQGQQGAAGEEEEDTELLFQQRTARLPDMSMTPRASLDAGGLGTADDDDDDAIPGKGKNKDPILHRMLDKNYRIMATPHKSAAGISPLRWKIDKLATPGNKGKEKQQTRPIWEDSPTSSPEMAVPQLRSAAFMSPMRAAYRGKAAAAAAAAAAAPRTPGVSVQTPATARKTRDVFGGKQRQEGEATKYADEITWESDSDDFGGMSPPKTIQFALPPSKLLQTPAREASKRIVGDILLTAGEDLENPSEYSPTMVQMNKDILDETF